MRIGMAACVGGLLATLLAPVEAWAQSPYEARGVKENRAYQELAPFEHVDTLSGNLMLNFIDLELPGDGGYSLRIQRTYNAKSAGEGPSRWTFGIADVPMMVRFPDGAPIGTPPEVDPDFYNPRLLTADGGEHRTLPALWSAPGRYRTKEFWEYRMDDHRVALPNGLECQYDALGFLIRIDSPFGVLAEVHWDNTPPTNPLLPQRALTQITQHVGGATRAITFTSDAGIWPLPRTMTFGARQWRYDGNIGFSKVVLPNGGRWRFEPLSAAGDFRVTTPNGGQTEYYFGSHPFRYVPDTTNPEYSTVLLHRVVAERPDRDVGGTWSYAYPGPDAPARITVVYGPFNVRKAYFYQQLPFADAGMALTRIETWDDGFGLLVEEEDRTYEVHAISERGGIQELLKLRKVKRDGRINETELYYSAQNFADFGQPYRIDERGHYGRTTTRTFETGFRTPFSGVYLPGLVHQESLASGGETFTKTFNHEPGTGFRNHENVYTIQRLFERDARGDVVKETDAVGLSTSYSYAWGVRQNTYTTEYTIERQIDSDSTVAWEKRNGFTTSFQYDGLFRRTSVQPPLGAPMVTTFDPAGQWMTVRRADGATFAETTYTLDGMGRVIHERNTLGVNKHYGYDVLGRRTFETLPFYDGQAWPITSWDYGALNRVLFETYPDGNYKRFSYANGNVFIVDEQDRQTRQKWEASGDPANRRMVKLTDATGNIFQYSYNALGRLVRVDQPGGTARTWVYTPGTDLLESETHPESGTTTYSNDQAGRLRTRRDTSGRGNEYHYDGNNRVRHIDVEGYTDYDTYFDYDAADNRTRARNAFVDSTFAYDGASRLISRSDRFPALAVPFTTGYTYTDLDAVDRLTYPSGTVVDYDYDREGRLAVITRVSGGGGELMRVLAHHASGAPARTRFGNGTEETRTFDERHRPDALAMPDLSLNYDYYPAGNVSRVADGRPGYTQTFEYDAVDRLVRYQRGPAAQDFTYDALGNRTFGPLGAQSYDPVTLRMSGFPYGGRGQLQSDGQATYTYTKTAAAMLETATVNGLTTAYRYDADDLRKITIPASGPHEYVIHGQGTQVLTEGAVSGPAAEWTRDYIYAGAQLVAALRPAPAVPKPIIGFSVSSQQVNEGTGSVYVAICVDTRGAPTVGTPIDVTFNTQNGSAVANTDYAPLANVVFTIPATTATGCGIGAPLGITNDAVAEGTESYSISMSVNPQQADVGIVSQTITILDDDAPATVTLAFDPASISVSEAAGQVLVSLRVTTSNGQPTQSLLRVYAFTGSTTATPGTDYQPIAGNLDIVAGTSHNTLLQAWLPIANDALDEPDELFGIALSPVMGSPTFGSPLYIYIIDDDTTGATMQMDFAAAQLGVVESAGSVPVTFRITTANGAPVASDIGFSYATVQETATPNVDYLHAVGTGVIVAGTANESLITVNLPIGNDAVPESTETFRIEIGLAPPGTSQVPMTRVFITDDDGGALTSGPPSELPLHLGEWQTLPPPPSAPPPLTWTVRPAGSELLSPPREEL